MTRDLTKGNEFKHVLFFSIPLVLGQFFQQLYNLVDRIVVGRYVGEDAIGAVGTCFPIMFFIIALIMGIAMGATTVISQYYGAKQHENLKRAVSTTLIFLGVASVIMGVVGFFISKPLLMLLRVDPDILEDATTYLKVIFIGMPGAVLYNAYTAILRGLGNSKSPMYILIAATLINIVLDLAAVIGLGLGVLGVAIATIISQFISALLSVAYSYRKVEFLRIHKGEWVFDRKIFAQSVRIGIPSGLQQTILSVGFMAMQGLINSFGKEMTSAITIASTIETLGTMSIMNIGMALVPFTGQNAGAGLFDRVKRGYRSALLLILIVYIASAALILSFNEPIIRLFMPADAHPSAIGRIIEYSKGYINFIVIFTILMGVMFASNSVLRGAGDVIIPLFTSLIALTVRVVAAYIMAGIPEISYRGLWYSLPIGWVIATSISLSRYLSGKWKEKVLVRPAPPAFQSDSAELVEAMPEPLHEKTDAQE